MRYLVLSVVALFALAMPARAQYGCGVGASFSPFGFGGYGFGSSVVVAQPQPFLFQSGFVQSNFTPFFGGAVATPFVGGGAIANVNIGGRGFRRGAAIQAQAIGAGGGAIANVNIQGRRRLFR